MGKNITADQGRNERCIGISSVTNNCNQNRNNVYRRALNPTWNRQALNTERMLVLVEKHDRNTMQKSGRNFENGKRDQ